MKLFQLCTTRKKRWNFSFLSTAITSRKKFFTIFFFSANIILFQQQYHSYSVIAPKSREWINMKLASRSKFDQTGQLPWAYNCLQWFTLWFRWVRVRPSYVQSIAQNKMYKSRNKFIVVKQICELLREILKKEIMDHIIKY